MKPHIFISCGQYLEEEKKLGIAIKELVEQHTPFGGYFAEEQNSVNGLVANILERLYDCAGFISVMHPRGMVTDDKGRESVRASVWIEQEVAMIALIQQLVRKDKNDLKVAAYAHKSIKLEGIRMLLHLNPMPFEQNDEILRDLQNKLPNWQIDQASAMKAIKLRRYSEEMQRIQKTPEYLEALRILTVDGSANDRYILPQLQRKQLASNWAALLEGLSNTTFFVQPVQGQDRRIQPSDRRYELKPEVQEFLEEYFSKS